MGRVSRESKWTIIILYKNFADYFPLIDYFFCLNYDLEKSAETFGGQIKFIQFFPLPQTSRIFVVLSKKKNLICSNLWWHRGSLMKKFVSIN